ncbi:MAG: ChbG/HpnK family deacetylase [Tannerellaceae bacterium]|jgi:CubicO group peptidase (beta-lactamase class C family)/predicted glycoside hydrolase/deacetylase ChbG (UPF0249 family)|nr:ChbG/HpnK family deacetylase [Tannerellaceae bacterium]
MKTTYAKTLCAGMFLCAATLSLSAQAPPTRLIIRADDMGAFHSANTASVACFQNGIETSVEVMAVTPWFPEAAKMLRENPGLDVGLHLVLTSEWENMKWRPLTPCPSLTDKNGYFYPMISPHKAYPGQSLGEVKWNLTEIENEFRAQIELGLRNIPQISHMTGHMFSTGFDAEVARLCERLGREYHIPSVDYAQAVERYRFIPVGYEGPKATAAEKEGSFLAMLDKLEAGKTYMFLDHPAYDNQEMSAVGHIGYEDVAVDRQGVVDLFTSEKVKRAIEEKGVELISYNELLKALPRSSLAAEKVEARAVPNYLEAVRKAEQDLHSLMILRNGKVVAEHWFGEHAADKPHALHSVSKTFTATAIGFAVAEGKLRVTDRVISFFPDQLPAEVNDNLRALEVRHLLTMSSGHDVEPGDVRRAGEVDWVKGFLAAPFVHKPGTFFVYNSLGTYVLSAILQKVTGEKLTDYLYPRLFRPLGIVGAVWEESPQGVQTGGWGLYLKTEDLAKMGLFILQKGKWNDRQLLPEAWFEEATSSHIASLPAGRRPEQIHAESREVDWLQGYGYQMWRSRHNSFRADGANGQYILILPEKDAVIVTTAHILDMQQELNLIWKYLLPALK